MCTFEPPGLSRETRAVTRLRLGLVTPGRKLDLKLRVSCLIGPARRRVSRSLSAVPWHWYYSTRGRDRAVTVRDVWTLAVSRPGRTRTQSVKFSRQPPPAVAGPGAAGRLGAWTPWQSGHDYRSTAACH